MNCSNLTILVATALCLAGGTSLSTRITGSVSWAGETQEASPQPRYQRTSYGREAEVLENEHIRLLLFKRLSGWGWGEIRTPDGTHVAVLDHLGEVMLRDQDIPMRLEAESFRRESTADGERLVFDVKSLVVREKLQSTSFDQWMRYPLEHPCLVGQVSIVLPPDRPILYLKYRLRATGNFYARYVRGPWLRVGEGSFAAAKDDAIFPGVEWVIGDEWSSGTDWFKDPWAMRAVPHPNKVAIPLMAISHDGLGIGLAWDPHQVATRWFNYRAHVPQPVFACPNFIDRLNHNLMGLMVPDATIESHENQAYAEPPLELKNEQRVEFDAEVWLSQGNSLQVVVDYVKRHGLPEPPAPRWPLEETLHKIAEAYNTNLWHEGQGFGIPQANQIGPHPPSFLDRYLRENAGTPLAQQLQAKLEWCRGRKTERDREAPTRDALLARGRQLLELQRDDGSFTFDPDGRHYAKDDFVVARSFIEPMGQAGDTALDITMVPARQLLTLARQTDDASLREGARKALEHCMPLQRPEAGDFWETPLHAPNLLAAGHAAVTFYLGYELFHDQRYKDKAVYWLRSILPFTHLWHPANVPMMYNTKPCLCSSDWYFANWVRDHVQWEVLSVFHDSTAQGIKWHEVDPEIDWQRFHRGITVAAIRWLSDHDRDDWRPHNLPETLDAYRAGKFDRCFPDTHNSTSGNYGGMFILPDPVAQNIYGVLDDEK
ncbi:MAG: hypothetical protein MUF48_19455 [Pirellulaceae bacterium]|jgi:hypothetical protein|nr:hypothetical protein [Pirellulaceae bacterium]